MNIAELGNRFEFYAINIKEIKHDPTAQKKAFLLCDVQDVQVSIKNGLKFPCLLMQTPEVEKEGDTDSIIEHFEGSFVVLDAYSPRGTAAEKLAVYNDCKAIADKIYKRMIKDSDEYFEGALVRTSEGSFGPVAGELLGWGVNFGFEQGFDGETDPDDWEDLS